MPADNTPGPAASKPQVIVADSAEQLSDDVAGRLVATLVAALAVRPMAFLAITAGAIMQQTLSALAALPVRDSVDWQRVSVWWADERFVAADSPDRNDLGALSVLLNDLKVDPVNIHRMPAAGAEFGDDVDAAAAAYAAELASAVPGSPGSGSPGSSSQGSREDVPHFDVVLLGVGPDGHCASLFPENPGVYELDAAVVGVRNSPKPPPTRITFTFRALDAANEIWFVAAGSSKAQAVARALSGLGRVEVPSAGPRGRSRTLWLIDRDAAAQLPDDIYSPPAS